MYDVIHPEMPQRKTHASNTLFKHKQWHRYCVNLYTPTHVYVLCPGQDVHPIKL